MGVGFVVVVVVGFVVVVVVSPNFLTSSFLLSTLYVSYFLCCLYRCYLVVLIHSSAAMPSSRI